MKKKIIFTLAALLLLAGAMLFALRSEREPEKIANAGEAAHAVQKQTSLTNGTDTAEMKKHIDTVLLIGTDKAEKNKDYKENELVPFYNYNQADVLALLVIDNDNRTITPIQLNRDTMTDVPWLDVLGKVGGTDFMQIALAYNFGSGQEDSCINTRNAVSSLLFDAPIKHFMQFSMGGISLLNDIVGGVTVYIEDDMTVVDPAFIQGSTVTLHGNAAEKFVRARMTLEDDRNTKRMARHREYIHGFLESANKAITENKNLVTDAIETLSSYMVTDMTVQQISSLTDCVTKYEVLPVQYYNGELKIGEFYEFYPDYDEIWSIVKKAYCG